MYICILIILGCTRVTFNIKKISKEIYQEISNIVHSDNMPLSPNRYEQKKPHFIFEMSINYFYVTQFFISNFIP